ncbi:hypothetical protein ACHAXT_004708 [Thalassiosira profunda]
MLPSQFVVVAGHCHTLVILLFGYFIPALASVKAVVRKDPEAYHQWSTYWLILHLYSTILSPILHFTLHPAFQILAVLWLSLPRYQGASVVYDRIVHPMVDRYEAQVDDAVEEAHRGVRRWIWSRLGGVMWVLMSEGGSLAGGIWNMVTGALGMTKLAPQEVETASSSSLPPRHSLRGALRRSSSIDGEDGFVPTKEFVRDFLAMLEQGLYVFSNVETNEASPVGVGERAHFKLCIFSYAKDKGGAFLISAVATGERENNTIGSPVVRLPLDNLMPAWATGDQGLTIECLDEKRRTNESATTNTVTIVLADEGDRDIMLVGLNACFPPIIRESNVG